MPFKRGMRQAYKLFREIWQELLTQAISRILKLIRWKRCKDAIQSSGEEL